MEFVDVLVKPFVLMEISVHPVVKEVIGQLVADDFERETEKSQEGHFYFCFWLDEPLNAVIAYESSNDGSFKHLDPNIKAILRNNVLQVGYSLAVVLVVGPEVDSRKISEKSSVHVSKRRQNNVRNEAARR